MQEDIETVRNENDFEDTLEHVEELFQIEICEDGETVFACNTCD